MSDPAVIAARRARQEKKLSVKLDFALEAGAREALAPIRERHMPIDRRTSMGSDSYQRVCRHCLGPREWPCPDARDAFSDEEIEQLHLTLSSAPDCECACEPCRSEKHCRTGRCWIVIDATGTGLICPTCGTHGLQQSSPDSMDCTNPYCGDYPGRSIERRTQP